MRQASDCDVEAIRDLGERTIHDGSLVNLQLFYLFYRRKNSVAIRVKRIDAAP